MPLSDSADPRTVFEYFSNEYADALQAYEAIEKQARALAPSGQGDELLPFIEQFLAMATRARQLAVEKSETNFAEWFEELIGKAESLRTAVPK